MTFEIGRRIRLIAPEHPDDRGSWSDEISQMIWGGDITGQILVVETQDQVINDLPHKVSHYITENDGVASFEDGEQHGLDTHLYFYPADEGYDWEFIDD